VGAAVGVAVAGGVLGAAAGGVLGVATGGAAFVDELAHAAKPAANRTATNRPTINWAIGRGADDWDVMYLNLV